MPLTTVASKWDYFGFIYNTTDTKWDFVALNQVLGLSTTVSLTAVSAGSLIVVLFNQSTSVVAPSLNVSGAFNVVSTPALWTTSGSTWVLWKVASGGETTFAPTPGTGGTASGVGAIEVYGMGATPTAGTPVVRSNLTGTANDSGSFTSTNANSLIIMVTGATAAMTTVSYDAALTNFTSGTSTASIVTAKTYTPNTLGSSRNHGNLVIEFVPTSNTNQFFNMF